MSEEKERSCCEFHMHTDRIRNLESRLKEAESARRAVHAEYENLVHQKWEAKDRIEGLEKRLSQAEALNEKLYSERTPDLKADKIGILEARLSNLMDVAGKMAGALEEITKVKNLQYNIPIATREQIIASKALAEWDGIKEGGK